MVICLAQTANSRLWPPAVDIFLPRRTGRGPPCVGKMSLRSIPPEMDGEKVALIDALLDRIADEHKVFLPLAIESGSRAWGFSSPDSDYDCRFVYVRRIAEHVTPWPMRDVIEFPPKDDL